MVVATQRVVEHGRVKTLGNCRQDQMRGAQTDPLMYDQHRQDSLIRLAKERESSILYTTNN